MNKRIFFILSLQGILWAGCSTDSGKNINEELSREVAAADSMQADVPEEILDKMVHAIPSPIELSSVIISSGAEYSSELINNADHVKNYIDDDKKALNLGVYGLDLGYINVYEKSFAAVNYIASISSLANDLKVGQFFDFTLLKRLSSSANNVDSLIEVSTNAYMDMSAYLRENKRGKVSALILAGSWIEGLYIASQIAGKTSNKDLAVSVGEQKITLDNLLIILTVYKNDKNISELVAQLEKLKEEYNKITITTEYKAPTAKEVDGMLVVEDNSSSIVDMKPEQLANITGMVSAIRMKIVS